MITQLTIQNFGLIDRLSLEFTEGLNVLTGETGAGKSILIGALRYALGERFNTVQMRDPKIPCIVEIAGELPEELIKENELFKEFMDGGDRQIIISRAYMPDGKNRIKLNGFSITLGQLKEIGDILVDFHGPNDHQMLLASESHIKILDRLCGSMGPLKNAYSALYAEYKNIGRLLQEIKEGLITRERDIDLLSHQIMELERVSLDRNKYEDAIEKETQLKNRERLYESVSSLIGIFDEIDAQIGGRLGSIIGKKLCGLADGRQVILVTHLPQIASFAGRHFKVLKKAVGSRTITTIDILDRAGRVKEMAQMMSGEKESGISLTHAEEMLSNAGKGK